jgi:hypothetical protein
MTAILKERKLGFTIGERLWLITEDYRRVECNVTGVTPHGQSVKDSLGNKLPMRSFGCNWGKVEGIANAC